MERLNSLAFTETVEKLFGESQSLSNIIIYMITILTSVIFALGGRLEVKRIMLKLIWINIWVNQILNAVCAKKHFFESFFLIIISKFTMKNSRVNIPVNIALLKLIHVITWTNILWLNTNKIYNFSRKMLSMLTETLKTSWP